ncbi:MAG: hypothetical protein HYY13_06765 [Nitrospirae bacterium]|nr:hypothetical protein [Nitrospirota bacterium]
MAALPALSGCEKIKSLIHPPPAESPAGQDEKAAAPEPKPLPAERESEVIGLQRDASRLVRDSHLRKSLIEAQEEGLEAQPPAESNWTKTTPQRKP